MGHDTNLVWKVTFLVVLQTISAWFIKDQSWYVVLLIAYMWGGIWNHSLALAIHEISHNLAFGYSYPALNRLLGIFSNLPLGIPVSITFRKYHLEHHKYQGDEILDVDLPSELEAKLFRGSFLKAVWLVLQPLFYAFRPVLCHPKMPNYWDFLNLIVQLAFDFLVYKYMGLTSLIYLLSCTLLSMGLHPMAGHFVSEHYLLSPGQETFSYYGILNKVAFNVGFHNEHHDFPNIPGSRLPQVSNIQINFVFLIQILKLIIQYSTVKIMYLTLV